MTLKNCNNCTKMKIVGMPYCSQGKWETRKNCRLELVEALVYYVNPETQTNGCEQHCLRTDSTEGGDA